MDHDERWEGGAICDGRNHCIVKLNSRNCDSQREHTDKLLSTALVIIWKWCLIPVTKWLWIKMIWIFLLQMSNFPCKMFGDVVPVRLIRWKATLMAQWRYFDESLTEWSALYEDVGESEGLDLLQLDLLQVQICQDNLHSSVTTSSHNFLRDSHSAGNFLTSCAFHNWLKHTWQTHC